jgi:phosphoenolpyruvate carboxykinase (ATP)
VKAIAEATVEWEHDPDFGYLVASSVPTFDDPELLAPRRLYERQGRRDEYEDLVARLKAERRSYMEQHGGLAQDVIEALG